MSELSSNSEQLEYTPSNNEFLEVNRNLIAGIFCAVGHKDMNELCDFCWMRLKRVEALSKAFSKETE